MTKDEALEQPAQEPVAFTNADELSELKSGMTTCYMYKEAIAEDDIALYTHPAPSWQGLSDDEIEVIDADCWVYPSDGSELFNHYKFARAIEQALKEKNHDIR